MFVIISGEITISLPDPEIEPEDFKVRYTEYTNLLKDIDLKAELERRKQLVAHRQTMLEELEQLKQSASRDSLDMNMNKITSVMPNMNNQRRLSSLAKKRKTLSRRSESVHHSPLIKKGDLGRPSRKESIVGIYEESERSYSDDDSDAYDVKGDIDEIDFLNLKTKEMYELGENLKDMFDQKANSVRPNAAQPHQTTEFDKLRKRVAYLSYGRKKRSQKQAGVSNSNSASQIPSNMQIHDQFIKEDKQKHKMSKQALGLQDKEGSGSDSDESIRQIKDAQRKKVVKIDLMTLSDSQIAKLTLLQIKNLQMEPKLLCSISEAGQQAVLDTQWLVPLINYKHGQSFGERSLREGQDYRAGTAVCTQDCTVKTLMKADYKRFLEKIELKNQGIKNAFWKVLPYFSSWPLKWLNNRLKYAMQEVHVIRNQEIYKEGEPADFVYLIWQGEFLLTKRVPVKAEHQVQLEKLIGPNQVSVQDHVRPEDLKVVKSALGDQGPKCAAQVNPTPGKSGQQTLTKTKMHGAFKLISLASGQMFGDDDVINRKPRFATVTCTSSSGVIFKIEAGEFFRKIESVEETKIEIRKQLYSKHQQIHSRLEMIEGVYNIKPSQIMAQVALETAEGADFEYMPTKNKAQMDPWQAKKDAQARSPAQKSPKNGQASASKISPASKQNLSKISSMQGALQQSLMSGAQGVHPGSQDGDRHQQLQQLSADKTKEDMLSPHAVYANNEQLWQGQSQVASDREVPPALDNSSMPQSSPRRKQEPGYMKGVASRPPVPIIKRTKGHMVTNEPFDIEEPDEFRPVNKTRKVQYPMVLRRYQVERNIKDIDLDDFRLAMDHIVKRKDNDEIFSKNLNKKSGRTSAEKIGNAEPEGKKKFMSSVQLVERQKKRHAFLDRTSPQKVVPHGFYSETSQAPHGQTPAKLEVPGVTSFNDSFHIKSANSVQRNINKPDADSSLIQMGVSRRQGGLMTPELPRLGQFQARGGSVQPNTFENPYNQLVSTAGQMTGVMKQKRQSAAVAGNAGEHPSEKSVFSSSHAQKYPQRLQMQHQEADQQDHAMNVYSGTQSLEYLGQNKTTIFESVQRNSDISGVTGLSQHQMNMQPDTVAINVNAGATQPSPRREIHTQGHVLEGGSVKAETSATFERLRQKSMPAGMRHTAGTPQGARQSHHVYSMMRPWQRNHRQLQRGNYSLAPSKVYMGHNTGHFTKNETEISKQRREQSRELREAQLLANSVPARILAEKTVKYFSVASTIRRPRRLEKLN